MKKRRPTKKGASSKPGAPGPSHGLTTRLRTAKKRSVSSGRWLERQLNDPYVQAARAHGYRSRAAFKLVEIDDRFRLFRPGDRVLDLGAAPGGWSQVAADRVGNAKSPQGQVLAVDLQPIDPLPGVTSLLLDIQSSTAAEEIKSALGGRADVVLSDMAANSTGHRQTDHLRIIALCEVAVDLALDILAPGGHFLAKVLRGGTENELLKRMKQHFDVVKHVKPAASRSDSAEMYVLAMGRNE
jgi:23S rRNA (uridine2552-2'-O)-methyltransferase